MKRFILALVTMLTINPASAAGGQSCAMKAADRSWVDASLAAWRQTASQRLKLSPQAEPTIIFFDDECRFERSGSRGEWAGSRHGGNVRLPEGGSVPMQVTSFAGQGEKSGNQFFVMSLLSVWQAEKIPIAADPRGLTAVFLHEFSHTRQTAPLASVFAAADALHKMGDDINDDSLQGHFEHDPAYVAVVEKEIDLLKRAASEPDDAVARSLAAQALALMQARQSRWFAGDDAYWRNYDDLFLTMEGFGQWVGYAWLIDPNGGRMGADAASKLMLGTRWWTQTEGFALFTVIDRFVPDWPARAFADQPALGIDLLRVAVSPRS